ncbi:MAG: hypothetical protein GX448_16215 [Planctomycetes bacterium]|nr:hypothetical protein [Planctomycetota bacterium]
MEEKRITVEELKQLMAADLDQLAQEVTEAMNTAQDGHIIADTEVGSPSPRGVSRATVREGDRPLAEETGGSFSLRLRT